MIHENIFHFAPPFRQIGFYVFILIYYSVNFEVKEELFYKVGYFLRKKEYNGEKGEGGADRDGRKERDRAIYQNDRNSSVEADYHAWYPDDNQYAGDEYL